MLYHRHFLARILESLGKISKIFEDSSAFNNKQFILLNVVLLRTPYHKMSLLAIEGI